MPGSVPSAGAGDASASPASCARIKGTVANSFMVVIPLWPKRVRTADDARAKKGWGSGGARVVVARLRCWVVSAAEEKKNNYRVANTCLTGLNCGRKSDTQFNSGVAYRRCNALTRVRAGNLFFERRRRGERWRRISDGYLSSTEGHCHRTLRCYFSIFQLKSRTSTTFPLAQLRLLATAFWRQTSGAEVETKSSVDYDEMITKSHYRDGSAPDPTPASALALVESLAAERRNDTKKKPVLALLLTANNKFQHKGWCSGGVCYFRRVHGMAGWVGGQNCGWVKGKRAVTADWTREKLYRGVRWPPQGFPGRAQWLKTPPRDD